jgi:TnpA family transposase
MSTTKSGASVTDAREYERPPRVAANDRRQIFELPPSARPYYRKLRTGISKLNFLLQYGYFRARHRFYEPDKYPAKDIHFLIEHHRFHDLKGSSKEDLQSLRDAMVGATSTRHRQEIMRLEGYVAFDVEAEERLREQAQTYANRQMSKTEALGALVTFCIEQGIVLPPMQTLEGLIGSTFQQEEDRLIAVLATHLDPQRKSALLDLLEAGSRRATLLSESKSIDQAVKARSLSKNAQRLEDLQELYLGNLSVIEALGLTDQALTHYAKWVTKARTSQLGQFRDPNKTCLYLLAFVKFQFFQRQDHAMKSFLAVVKTAHNKALKMARERVFDEQAKHAPILSDIVSSQQRLMDFASEILRIMEDESMTPIRKNELVRNLALTTLDFEDDEVSGKANLASEYLRRAQEQYQYYDTLEEGALALDRKLRRTVKLLTFEEEHSESRLLAAVQAYQQHKPIPLTFLTRKEQAAVTATDGLREHLVVALLFVHMMKAIKGGKLNLAYGFAFRCLHSYLIDDQRWQSLRMDLLRQAGLLEYADCETHLECLKAKLNKTYLAVNERIAFGKNGYLRPKPGGRFGVQTPALETPTHKYIAERLRESGNVSILQILREVEHHYPFLEQLTHQSQRHVTQAANPQTAYAALMALGCNIGPHKMGRLSLGINANELLEFVNWRMSADNLRKANKSLTDVIDEVALSRVYKVEDDRLYSSSDGKKVTVAPESLHAKYSFKYFGKESGVAVYSFVDEKQSLFHSTVFSATEREAAYVLDGLVHNTAALNRVHATDTHGYTEALFGLTHFLGISFAPRIKRIEEQGLYDFQGKAYYEQRGYRLLPRNKVDVTTIREHWDDMLRFVCTIRLGVSTASQLFARLNSYSSDHPLYKCLKAFGRIPKSQYLLTYYDDLRLRQRVQKQLNIVELSNKFHDAVFWDRKSEFQVGTKEEQEKYTLARSVIQNAIILWNYLTLSTQLVAIQKTEPDAYDAMVEEIGRGSVLTWRHVDFQGKYDFRRPPKITKLFPLKRIQKLEVKPPERTIEEQLQEWDRP